MPTPLKTRVLVADDHPVVLSGLMRVLDQQADFEVVGHARDGAEAVERVLSEDVDLAILDVSMPRMTGLQAAREITQRKPDVRVLMLSMHENEEYLFEALAAGASGYVLKTAVDRDLVAACRAAMRGEPFLYPGAVRALIREHLDRARRGEPARTDPLTPREQEIVKLIAEAHTNDADRRAARDQQEDRRAPPREHPREARHERPRRAHALRDPPRARPAIVPGRDRDGMEAPLHARRGGGAPSSAA